MLLALPRRLLIRIVTGPEGGVVKLIPLRLTVCGDVNCAVKGTATGPEPVLTVTTMSPAVPVISRLVTGTVSETLKLPVTAVPGVPPVHPRTISPIFSAKPSIRTVEGVAPTVQVRGGWAWEKAGKRVTNTKARVVIHVERGIFF